MSGDQQTFPSMHDAGTDSFTFRVPVLINMSNAFGSTAAANNLQNVVFQFNPSDCSPTGVFSASCPLQAARLQYMFSTYQEYQFAKVSYHFQPRWTLPAQPVGAMTVPISFNQPATGANTYAAVAAYPVVESAGDVEGMDADFANDKVMTWLGDPNDAQNAQYSTTPGGTAGAGNITRYTVTDSLYGPAIDEMFQAQKLSNSSTHTIRQPHSGAIIPHQYDLTAANLNSANSNQTLSTLGIQGVAPARVPWVATRKSIGTAGIDNNWNYYQPTLGLKLWIWDPYNQATSAVANVKYGLLWLNYHFSFRSREYRQIPTTIGFAGSTEQHAAYEHARSLQKGLGHLDLDQYFHLVKLGRAANIDEYTEILNTVPNVRRAKRQKQERSDPQTQGSHSQTPQSTFLARKGR